MSIVMVMLIIVMMITKTMKSQFRVTSGSGSSLLDILGPWGGLGFPLLPDPTAYQVIIMRKMTTNLN